MFDKDPLKNRRFEKNVHSEGRLSILYSVSLFCLYGQSTSTGGTRVRSTPTYTDIKCAQPDLRGKRMKEDSNPAAMTNVIYLSDFEVRYCRGCRDPETTHAHECRDLLRLLTLRSLATVALLSFLVLFSTAPAFRVYTDAYQ
jgi:hypothetical protein